MRSRLFCLAFLAISLEARAQTPKPDGPPKTFDLEAIDAYVAGVVRDKGITGLSLAIARDGKIVFAKGYGKRSLEDGAPVEPETVFAAGSVTKQFACASILLLAEEGKLSVDDKVAKYFPDLTRAGDITLYQLMTHTSGYPDYYPLDFVDRRMSRPIPIDGLIRQYAGAKLDFEPGARWSYSNTGFMILGRVVEKVGGESFGAFLEKRILGPAGMKTAVLDPTPGSPGLARGYTPFALEGLQPAIPEGPGWLYAAGGLWASASDLARWDIALMEGRVLKPETIRLMTTPVALADGRVRDYGCGLGLRRDEGTLILSHGGAVSGFRASNTLVPRTKSAVVVLINDEKSDPGLSRMIVGLLGKSDLDRKKLADEFSAYLTEDRVKAAAPKLKALGEPEEVEVVSVGERGGLEVASIRLKFKSAVMKGLMYRSTDGKIEQLLFEKD
jgi:D-alanyl-D-alanine carboxypeptidase